MNNNIKVAEKFTFWQFIQSHKYIQIPIIQRDYAQGRDSKEKIRMNFLNALIKAFTDEPIELDFVYGITENKSFEPLDGQQRLTTLFLLHWYIATKEKKVNETIKTELKKFTYKTRFSSHDFCNSLVDSNIIIDNNTKNVSEKIKNENWFFWSWKNDPTIKSMLVMIDTIHNLEFFRNNEIWNKLSDVNNCPISFYQIKLENFGLSDDLYIKMNARGKQLTEYENFKASFERYIEGNNYNKTNWEDAYKNNPFQTFSHKIDTDWTNLFWIYRGEDNQIDNEIIKFINGIAINCYAQSGEIIENESEKSKVRQELESKAKEKNVTDHVIKTELIERRIKNLYNNISAVLPEDFPNKETFEYLKKCFDVYIKNHHILPCNLPLWNFCKNTEVKINDQDEVKNSLFIEFIKDKETTYSQRVLFYAQTEYLLKNKDVNDILFSDWLRVCRNILNNSNISDAGTFVSAIKLINELSTGCSNIYKYLASTKLSSQFANRQIEEEILKSKIILISGENKNALFETEDTNLCKGKIEFALYCLDNPTEINFDYNKLLQIKNVFIQYLNDDDITNELRRCLLTIGNNDFYHYWGTWSHNTDTMKRCLIDSTDDLKNHFVYGGWKHYLKELINLLVSKSTIEIIEQYIIPENMPKWKEKLIKEAIWLDKHCTVYYIMGIPNNDNSYCLLFNNWKKPNSRKDCKRIS